MADQSTVFVVDDDESVREAVCALLRTMGLKAEAFASAEEFLIYYVPGTPGCVVSDVRMPGMSGIELQEKLGSRGVLPPVIIQTAYANTRLTVRAMEAGAVTVLEKPYNDDELWDAVRKALTADSRRRAVAEKQREIRQRLQVLTSGERQVLDMIVEGESNKSIASKLGVSVRAIEARRSGVYRKMQARSVAELVRMVIEADSECGPD